VKNFECERSSTGVDLLQKELLPKDKDSRRLTRIHLETLIPML
jgi:hypothetical protein